MWRLPANSKARRSAAEVFASCAPSNFAALRVQLLHASLASSSPPAATSRALGTWNASSTQSTAQPATSIASKAMQFAKGGGGGRATSTRRNVEAVPAPATAPRGGGNDDGIGPAEVKWVQCERMDFLVQYTIPATWCLKENVRENMISVQAFPDPSAIGSGGVATVCSVHGITLNGFAYHKKVADPNPDRLLDVFLKRFAPSSRSGVQILRRSAPLPAAPAAGSGADSAASDATAAAPTSAATNVEGGEHWVQWISSRIGGAVCELSFEPAGASPRSNSSPDDAGTAAGTPPVVRARGMCRAFYATNRRFHYIVMAAVPEEEYAASEALIAHALMHVVESKVDAAAQNF